jgi:hypothetical protein
MKKKTRLNQVVSIIISFIFLIAMPQFTFAESNLMSSEEKTESIIDRLGGTVSTERLSEKDNAFYASNGNCNIVIPKSGNNEIELQNQAACLTVKLPYHQTLNEAKRAEDTVIYSSNSDPSIKYAVQGLAYKEGSGLRCLIIIENSTAPKRYSYEFNLNKGQRIVRSEDCANKEEATRGYLYIVDENKAESESIFYIEPAWAKDSNGKDIPTHYEIEGNTVTQVVEFDENTTFPVVADPAMSGYYYKKANVSYSNEWSSAKRCSDNVTASKGETGSISCSKTVSFSGSVSGSIYGISTIGIGKSYSTTTGYTLTFKGPATKYMTYKAYYKVENGTRQKYHMNTNKLVSSNKYTVKNIQYGRYALKSV